MVASAESTSALRLARAMADLTHEMGLDIGPDHVRTDVHRLVEHVGSQYDRFARWPAVLNPSGLPFEVSLKMTTAGTDLRCVVDTTDYAVGPAANWPSYVDMAEFIAGPSSGVDKGPDSAKSSASLRSLLAAMLDGVPAAMPSRLMHGLGYVGSGGRRGTLYFRTRWLDAEGLGQRLPLAVCDEPARGVFGSYERPGEIEVLAHDLADGQPHRTKLYTWIEARSDTDLDEIVAAEPSLAFGAALAGTRPENQRPGPEALFRQSALVKHGATEHRFFFFAGAWGWADQHGVAELLSTLAANTNLDLSVLSSLQRTFAAQGFRSTLGMVAAGGAVTDPSVTLYFWPHDDSHGPLAGPGQVAPTFARVQRLLRASDGPGADDHERPPIHETAASTQRPTPVTSIEAVAAGLLVESDEGRRQVLVDELLRRQRPDGSWGPEAWLDPLASTSFVAHGLASAQPSAGDVGDALRRARLALGTTPLPRDALVLGLWLRGWVATGGDPASRLVERVVEVLDHLQGSRGSWPGSPTHHIDAPGPLDDDLATSAGALAIDAEGAVTTGTVRRGLHEIAQTLGSGADSHGRTPLGHLP